MQPDHSVTTEQSAQLQTETAADSDVDPEQFIEGIESFDVGIDRETLRHFALRRPDKDEIYFENDAQEKLYDILMENHVGKDNAIYSAELADQVHPKDGDGQPETRDDLATLVANGAPILAGGNGYFIADSLDEVADYGEGMIGRIMGNLKRLEASIEACIVAKESQRREVQQQQEKEHEQEQETRDQTEEGSDGWSAVEEVWGETWAITVRTEGSEAAGNYVQSASFQAIRDYLLGRMDSHSFEAGDRPDNPEDIPDDLPKRERQYAAGDTVHTVRLEAPEDILDAEFPALIEATEEALPDGWDDVTDGDGAGER